MHQSVTDFIQSVKDRFPQNFQDCSVLEVGSRYINGTVRTFFRRCDYLGLDLAYGPLVDVVLHVADRPLSSLLIPTYRDTVISVEALEHDSRWAESLPMMLDTTRPGGLLVITCAGPGRPEHGTKRSDPASSPATTDYYRNVDEDMFWSALRKTDFSDWRLKVADGDLQFWGVKG
jgi:SAM-dependent methyltransferase